jgi:hypothetical protein
MLVEDELFSLLEGLVDRRCYPDVTPDAPVFPCIVYQVVGGRPHDYLERKLPDCEHYRVQICCWAKSRASARVLALQVHEKIVEQGAAFKSAKALDQAVGLYESALKLFGTRQDFGIWIKVR